MFQDRHEAGRLLAERIRRYLEHEGDLPQPVVLALPRGGVPVAFEIARTLKAPLDVVLVRKIGLPHHPELAAGAIVDGPEPVVVWNEEVLATSGVSEAAIEAVRRRELEEIERRRAHYLAGREPPPVEGRTVILVDDGVATGATMLAAIRGIRQRRPAKVIVAVPVAPPDTLDRLSREADDVICLECPEWFWAVGAHYRDFRQLTDEEVVALLREAAASAREGQRAPGSAGNPES